MKATTTMMNGVLQGVSEWRATAWSSGLHAADNDSSVRRGHWRQSLDRADWLTAFWGIVLYMHVCNIYGMSVCSADVKFWHWLSSTVAFDNTTGSRCRTSTDTIRQRPGEMLPWLLQNGGFVRKFVILCHVIFIASHNKWKCYQFLLYSVCCLCTCWKSTSMFASRSI